MNKIKLSNVCEVITKGTTPSTVGDSFVKKGINFVKSESITDSKYLDNSIFEHISLKTDEKLKRSRLKKDDLLFSIAGAYLGKIAVVKEKDLPANTNQAVGIVRINRNIADVDYIYYFFSQKHINDYIKRLSAQSSQPNLNLDILGKLEFDNKPLLQQKQISNLLSKYDEKINVNKNINNILEALAKTLYDYWFLQFEFPNEEGKPYKSSGGKMVYNEEIKREIPEGWEVKTLNGISRQVNGYPFSTDDYLKEGNYKLYTIKNVQDNGIDTKSDAYFDKLPSNINSECLLGEQDIIMSLTGNVGRVGIVFENNALLNQRVLKLVEKNVSKEFLMCVLKDKGFRKQVEQISTGTSQKNLSPVELGKLNVLIPNESIIKQFNKKTNGIVQLITNNNKQNQILAELRDFLLPMLMNGQVTFKNEKNS